MNKEKTKNEESAAVELTTLLGEVLDERELPDDHPVYWDYFYVCDGKVIRSDIKGTIIDLKRDLRSMGYDAKKITNCDIVGRSKALSPS